MNASRDVVRGVLTEHHEMLRGEIVRVDSANSWEMVERKLTKSATPGNVIQLVSVAVAKYTYGRL